MSDTPRTAGDLAMKYLNRPPTKGELAEVYAVVDLLERENAKLRALITKAQSVLARQLEPGGISDKAAVNELHALLDGPEAREAMK